MPTARETQIVVVCGSNTQLREELSETNARQRKIAMQTNALQEGHSQLHGLLWLGLDTPSLCS